jgi:hypothetical protein
MCRKSLLLLIAFCIAQIEKVFVETYYVADENDAKSEFGGKLPLGSKTYRVYVDLAEGSSLLKMYGDNNHTLIFSSTEDIFNNTEDGVSLGYELSRNRIKENTVALDSWLTLGQVAKFNIDVQFGVPKVYDQNGASTAIGIGDNIDYLLKNNVSEVGIPLTSADGLMPNINKPLNWLSQGFIDPLTNEEVTIFGNAIVGKTFESKEAFIRNAGTLGVFPDSNQILLAQITTLGELKFELNLEVLTKNGKIVKYVADAKTLMSDEIYSPLLKYPPTCGCQDPNYLEYNSSFACNDISKCKTPIVFGCMDPLACNFNSKANYNIESLCCYIGYCNDNDIEVICPNLPARSSEQDMNITIYPNPVFNELNIVHNIVIDNNAKLEIFNALGQLILTEKLNHTKHTITNLHTLNAGNYSIQLSNALQSIRKNFIKFN